MSCIRFVQECLFMYVYVCVHLTEQVDKQLRLAAESQQPTVSIHACMHVNVCIYMYVCCVYVYTCICLDAFIYVSGYKSHQSDR